MAWLGNHGVCLALSALLSASLTTTGPLAEGNRPLHPSGRGSQPAPQPLSAAGEGLLCYRLLSKLETCPSQGGRILAITACTSPNSTKPMTLRCYG